jgi:hypothetical protein
LPLLPMKIRVHPQPEWDASAISQSVMTVL